MATLVQRLVVSSRTYSPNGVPELYAAFRNATVPGKTQIQVAPEDRRRETAGGSDPGTGERV